VDTLHVRHFSVPLEIREESSSRGPRRTLFGRVVPYGETVEYWDDERGREDRERFVLGSLRGADARWHKVKLQYSHVDGFPNILGYGSVIEERSDGAYASFRLYPSTAEKTRELVEESDNGLSLAFYALESRRANDGVIERARVYVEHVALVPEAQYAGARVLALRSRQTAVEAPEAPAGTPNLDAVRADLRLLRMTPEERRAFEAAQ